MSEPRNAPIVAVDIGNSRIKLAWFETVTAQAGQLPSPSRLLDLVPTLDAGERAALRTWLENDRHGEVPWFIGSVQRDTTSRLVELLRDEGATRITLLASSDLDLKVSLPRPDMVGIDRLLGAVAANRLRNAARPAIVVDLGTAITVDLVSPQGAFMGGAILPGIFMSARAMHEFTDLLPFIDMHALAEPPPALGTGTVEAMTSGLFWGAVGGVRTLIELFSPPSSRPEVFLTGGAAPSVAPLLAADARHEPNLVLSGIALAAAKLADR
ncbi:MAG TPA: type III pantothenate kinase [Pirellulales bacterium]|nr:type III pantothenate kinase [Pirellulales bacterium]